MGVSRGGGTAFDDSLGESSVRLSESAYVQPKIAHSFTSEAPHAYPAQAQSRKIASLGKSPLARGRMRQHQVVSLRAALALLAFAAPMVWLAGCGKEAPKAEKAPAGVTIITVER